MKAERIYPKAIITAKGTRWVENGHPWIYEAEIKELSSEPENGSLVDAVSEKGRYLGTGFYSKHSKIRIRLISRNANDTFDEAFWRRRIQYAWDFRRTVMRDDLSCCRIIFGEADGFPGLTMDRFNDILVTQTLSIGMERLKPVIIPAAVEILRNSGEKISGVYERNDVSIRQLEGLEEYKGWYMPETLGKPESTRTRICENGFITTWMWKTARKPGSFLTRNTTALPWPVLQGIKGFWTASPIRAPLP